MGRHQLIFAAGANIRRFYSIAFAVLLVVGPSILSAAEPTIRNLSLRGLQIGATTTLTVDGADLLPNPRILLPIESASQKLLDGATAARAVFELTLPDDIVPGLYNLRLATDDGATAPFVIGVDRLPQLASGAELAGLPAAVHGSVAGGSVFTTRFRGVAGQNVTIDVEAQRLGGKLRPVVHLYDARRLQLAWSWPSPACFGDAQLTAKLPADGDYFVELHDLEYAAAAPNHFRLKIGELPLVQQTFPLAIERGKSAVVEFLGTSLQRLEITSATVGDSMPLPWGDLKYASGPRPRLAISDMAEFIEAPAADGIAPLPALPLGLSGRLATPGEEDRFKLATTPGKKLRFEILAEREGSPLDAVVVLRNAQGQQLARGDDGPGTTDPVLEYAIPDGLMELLVDISDLHGRGGTRFVYRLKVEESGAATNPRDYSLKVAVDRIRVPDNSRTVVPVIAERRGYRGAIDLTIDKLPEGVTFEHAQIPAEADGALVTLRGAAAKPSSHLTSLRGMGDGEIARLAEFVEHPLSTLQPWLQREFALSFTSDHGLSATWGQLPSEPKLVPGIKFPLPFSVKRPEGASGQIRVSLLTSQNVPKQNGRPDLNKALRAEAAVELAADRDEGQLTVLVPVDLPGNLYDLALQADLLSADKQKVLASACTEPLRLALLNPLHLELTGGHRYEAVLDAKLGATVKLAGKIERRGGLQGDVTIQTTGLPAGVRTAPVIVKADAMDFELMISFPANFKPGDVSGIRVFATAPPDAKAPQALVRSPEHEIVVALQPMTPGKSE